MKIAYEHLLNFIEDKPSIEDISEKLFQLGHEHEIDKNILNFEFTPNRGDCLSLDGLSRDLNIFYRKKNNFEIFSDSINNLDLDFENNAQDKCPLISFLRIDIDLNKKIKDYDSNIDSYFKDLSITKKNFFTDISNYLTYETGQPTHCYDFSSLKGKIILKELKNSHDFNPLINDETISLKANDLVFYNDNKVINLAGIMGGKNSACTNKTKSVLIECAYFEPKAISGKALKYNLNSNASHKFERGVDPSSHDYVLRRFLKIVDDHACVKNFEIFKQGSYQNSFSILKDYISVNNILGTTINENTFSNYLINLGFTLENDQIIVPPHRHDIKSINDIAEEIARLIGYDNIKNSPVNFPIAKNPSESFMQKEHAIKSTMLDMGFNEVINFPFTNIKDKNNVTIDNPLDKNRSRIRSSLTSSLLDCLLYNERRQKDSIKLFEISDVYTKENPLQKRKKLAIIASGRLGKNQDSFTKKINITRIKEIFTNTNLFGEDDFINISRSNLNTKIKSEIVYAEKDFNDIKDCTSLNKPIINSDFKKYRPISEYPSSYRDISFSITNIDSIDPLKELLYQYNNIDLKECFIFDYYQDNKNKTIKIGFRFVFQSLNYSMKDDEIDIIISDIITETLKLKGVTVPGYN